MSIESVMPSSHLILCRPLLLSPSPSIRVFSNESALHIRWPKYWGLSFSEKYVNLKLYPEPSNCLFIPFVSFQGRLSFVDAYCVSAIAPGAPYVLSH